MSRLRPGTPWFRLSPFGGGGTPGGLTTQVQFNDGGVFGGDSGLTFNKTTDALTIGGALTINGDFLLSTSDNGALGSTTKMWSDLFLASGAVINFNNGNFTITHSQGASAVLTFSGIVTHLEDVRFTKGSQAYLGTTDAFPFTIIFNGADRMTFSIGSISINTTITPASNDGAALGTTALMFSDLFLASGSVVNFNNGNVTLTHSAAKLALAGGTFSLDNKISTYNNVVTVGWGIPAIYGTGRSAAQTGDVASVATYTCGVADGSFIISCNANCTAYTAGTMAIQCTYTDETNTARTLVLSTSNITGTIGTSFATTGAFEGLPLHIRVKASTAITIKTVGTAFTGTYNVEGCITQIG